MEQRSLPETIGAIAWGNAFGLCAAWMRLVLRVEVKTSELVCVAVSVTTTAGVRSVFHMSVVYSVVRVFCVFRCIF